jgi:hypothetical protein
MDGAILGNAGACWQRHLKMLAIRFSNDGVRAFPANPCPPEKLCLFVFSALSDAEAIPLRLEML